MFACNVCGETVPLIRNSDLHFATINLMNWPCKEISYSLLRISFFIGCLSPSLGMILYLSRITLHFTFWLIRIFLDPASPGPSWWWSTCWWLSTWWWWSRRLLTNHPLERTGAKLFRECEVFSVIWSRDLIPTTNQCKQPELVNIIVRRSKRHRETYRKSRKLGVSRFWFVSSITQAV